MTDRVEHLFPLDGPCRQVDDLVRKLKLLDIDLQLSCEGPSLLWSIGRGMLHWTLPMPGSIASFFQSLI